MMERPKIERAKKSGEVKDRATFASCGASSARQIALIKPPINEDTAEMPSARPAFPFLFMGYPSSRVAVADGVPGVFSRIADMLPPYILPQKSPQSITRATSESSL